MKVGIDLDNTIIDYTGLFHRAAKQMEWLSDDSVGTDKSSVKSYFIEREEEPKWTELQGIVYGQTIANAKAYEGVVECLQAWLDDGHELSIISHKTQYPIIGEKLDFHRAALEWLGENIFSQLSSDQFDSSNVFFNPTIARKVAVVAQQKCDVFIDDLKKIFLHDDFPIATRKVLFAPLKIACASDDILQVSHWQELLDLEKALAQL